MGGIWQARGKDQGGPPRGPTLAAAALLPLMLPPLLLLLGYAPVTAALPSAGAAKPTKGPTYILPMDPFANPYYAPFMASYSNVNPFSPVAAGLANSDSYAYGPSKVPWRQDMLPGMSPCEGGPCDLPGVGGTPAVGLGTVLQPPSDPNRVVGASAAGFGGAYVGGPGNTYGSIYPPYGGPLRVGPPLEQSAPPPGAAIGEGVYTKDFPQFREVPLLDSTSTVTPSPLIEHDHAIYSLIGLIKQHTDQHGVSDDSELPGSGLSGGDGVSFAEVSASDLLPAAPAPALAMIATPPAPPVVPPPSEAFSAALEQYRQAQAAALGALQDNAINLQELSKASR